ncbi:MFS transporter [Actinomadura meridiana]|uniref:MFS transporter n=1 Tax=Actinomadura meridiana TaxID=559626 RepID=A0ABP8C1T5_9ACTN
MSVETVTFERAGEVRERWVLPTAFVTLLTIGTDLFVVSPLLPSIAGQYGVSVGAAGNAVTFFSVAYLVAAPCVGMVADRVGRRFVLVAGLALFAAANVLTGAAPSFGVLLGARVLAGVGAAAVTPSTQALVGQVAPADRRGTWMSVAVAGFLISLTTGAPTGTALASAFSWRVTFVALGGLALVLVVVNAVSWPRRAGAVTGEGPVADRVRVLTKIRAVSVTGLWAFAVYALYTYLGTALRTVAGLSTGLVAVALVLFGLGAVVGSLFGGRLADRFGARRMSTISLVLLAVFQLVVDLMFHAPKGVLVVVLGAFALSAYPCLPAFQARLVEAFPGQVGSVFAWNSCFMYLGTSLGAAAGGALMSSAGFGWIPVVGAAAGALGALVSWRFAITRR